MSHDSTDPRLLSITDALYRVSCKLLIRSDMKLLVVQESQGWWGLPGGGIDYGESPLDCIVRELHEELALSIDIDHISDTPWLVSNQSKLQGIPRLTLLYRYDAPSTFRVPISANDRELPVRLVTSTELSQLPLAPPFIPLRDDLIRYIMQPHVQDMHS
jgi:8-oxo-dGTP pyrophosphatase MutT (NUDIX family)